MARACPRGRRSRSLPSSLASGRAGRTCCGRHFPRAPTDGTPPRARSSPSPSSSCLSMPPNSSTSSSDAVTGTTSVSRAPAPRDRRHTSRARVGRIALIVLLVLGPLVAAEGAIRLLIAADRLPPARAHLRDFEIMWMNLARQGVPDVLILGDSVTQQGIDPAVLASELGSQSGRDVTAYNAASAAAGFGMNLSIARQLAREGRLPGVAIVGIQPGAITSDASLRE